MALFIEQNTEQARLAFSLQRRADIESIRMVEATANCRLKREDVTFPLLFHLKHQAEDVVLLGSKLTIPIRFGLKAVTADHRVPVIVVACRVEVDYNLYEGYTPTPEEIDAFKQGNAIFNCWTYFREYVQSTVARMNFPPLTLPFLRMVPKASAQAPAAPRAIEASIAKTEQEPERKSKRRKLKGGEKSNRYCP
jgi:hypothetical protein